MDKLILYLVMKKHGLKRYERFRFSNQKENAVYFFGKRRIYKVKKGYQSNSNVSLNWLLDPKCKIQKVSV